MQDTPPAQISDADPLRGDVVVPTALPAKSVAEKLTHAGRRGKLPGFEAAGEGGFRIDCDAVPFDYSLVGQIKPEGEGSSVTLRAVRRRLMPWVFGVTLAATVWPGVWLTDSLMGVYWASYSRWSEQMPWLTYAWYLPITALPLPWLWRTLTRKSEAMAKESATKLVNAVRAMLSTDPA